MKSWSKLLVFFLLFGYFSGVITPVQFANAEPVNLMPNPGFEQTVTNAKWLNHVAAANWAELWIPVTGGVVSIDRSVYHSGQSAVKIDHPVAARTNVSVDGGVTVQSGKVYKLGLWMKTQDVGTNGVILRTYYYNGSTKVSNGPTVTIKGTTDWTNKELTVNVPANVNNIRVEVMFESGTGVVWIDDASLTLFNELTGIGLNASYLKLNKGQQYQVTPAFTPSDAGNQSVVWSTSDASVAGVVYGLITAKDYGTAVIRVSTPDGKLYAECTVAVENPVDAQDLEQLRLRWYDRLTGNSLYNPNDPDMVKTVTEAVYRMTNESGTGRWDTMNKASDKAYLWADNASTTASSHMANSYNIIRSMALAYSYKASPVYKNAQLRDDIIYALEWMYKNRYNENISKIYDNWFHWEIAIPKALGDIMVLMYDELSPELINKYIKVIDWFVPDPTKRKSLRDDFRETGANLLDKAIAVTVRGIVGKSPFKVIQGSTAIGTEYLYVTKGDGVFADGSLIQHSNIAYTGGYGSVWLNNTSDLMYLLKESKWAITDPNVNNVFHWVSNVFEPVIYKGQLMDLVNGREISREASIRAKATILCIVRLAESAPAELALQMKRMVKEWVSKDTEAATYYEGMALYDMVLLKAIMNDASIQPRGELVKSQVFAGMDRVVHLREGFGLGISMFSDRISAFEFGNGENLKGWYTGMGMTSLYNDDLLQYKDHYWPTVDSYRLAGTTTDGSNKPPVAWASYYNPRKWVGGATLENVFSTAGMDFSLTGSTGSSLEGKKSWFTFDDEIVALGSGIRGGDGRTVETIVENRKINDAGDNPLIVNGQVKESILGWEETMNQVSWAHLAGNVTGSDIGYYFPKSPEAPSIHGLREARTGAWKDINTTQSATPRTKNYVSLAFNHGENPLDASYSYVLLPGKSVDGTEAYSNNPDIQVLSNTSKVHAAREKKLGITAVNFWEPGSVDSITSENPAAVMLKEAGGIMTVSVSDPTQSQDKVIIELNKEGLELLSKDPAVEVLQLSPTIKLSVSVDGAIGRTFGAKVKLRQPALTLVAPESVAPGKQFTVNVGLKGLLQSTTSKVYAQDLTFSYDPNVFGYASVESADEGTKVVGVNQTAPGTLRILAVNEDGLSADKELLRLAFTAKDGFSVKGGTIAATKAELGTVPDVGVLQADLMQITVTVTVLPGDINRDGAMDVRDLALAASYYLIEHDEAGWDQAKAVDINRNGRIDITDLTIIAKEIFEWQ